jgi:hypothetical protein
MVKPSTSAPRHREEVVNTHLAILMGRHGVDAEAETLHRSGASRPDVLFTLGGLRAIIEGKFSGVPDADNIVTDDATRRVTSGICHIAVAVVYPEALRSVPMKDLVSALAAARLRYRIFSEAGQTDWAEATPSELLAALRRVHGALARDDVVAATRLASLVFANALIFQEQLTAYGDDARAPFLRTYGG